MWGKFAWVLDLTHALAITFDPVAQDEYARIYVTCTNLKLCANSNQALQGADALDIVTEWTEFRSPD